MGEPRTRVAEREQLGLPDTSAADDDEISIDLIGKVQQHACRGSVEEHDPCVDAKPSNRVCPGTLHQRRDVYKRVRFVMIFGVFGPNVEKANSVRRNDLGIELGGQLRSKRGSAVGLLRSVNTDENRRDLLRHSPMIRIE
jgi:hypothetical protein